MPSSPTTAPWPPAQQMNRKEPLPHQKRPPRTRTKRRTPPQSKYAHSPPPKGSKARGGEAGEITVQTAKVIQDLTLPKSIITRLAKGVLPANTQIQANAILAMSKSATVFISYLASQYGLHIVSMPNQKKGVVERSLLTRKQCQRKHSECG